jgi:hypothetical protein
VVLFNGKLNRLSLMVPSDIFSGIGLSEVEDVDF